MALARSERREAVMSLRIFKRVSRRTITLKEAGDSTKPFQVCRELCHLLFSGGTGGGRIQGEGRGEI